MIITLTGDNRHLLQDALRRLIAEFESRHGALAIERFSADEVPAEQILNALTAPSLFSPEKLVVVHDFETNKDLVEQTSEIVEQTPDETTAVLVIGKLDKRAAYGKILQKQTDFREFKALAAGEVVGWVVEAAREKGGQIDRATAQYLVDYVGADQLRLSNELDKLILFDPKITRQTIDQLSERQPSSTVFELLDAGFNGQQKRALQLYEEQRRQQVEPLNIVAMIGWQLHILAIAKTAKGRAAALVAKDAGVHPFVVQKSLKLTREITLAKLRQLVHRAVELETTIKSRAIDADDAVKHFLLSLTS